MAIPYHTHNFTIPTATKQDVEAGSSDTLVITPSVVGSAVTQDISYFATAAQGALADGAVQRVDAKALAYKDKILLSDIITDNQPTEDTVLSGNSEWIKVATAEQGNKADTAVQPGDIGAVAKLNTVSIDYISGSGTKTDDTFLSGAGRWKSLVIPTDFVPNSRRIITSDDGYLTGGNTLDQDITLDVNEKTKQKLALATTALQPKNVNLDDIKTNGTPATNKFLSGDGWKELTGGGDMFKSVYDPQNIQKDAFDMESMTNGASKFVYSAEDKNKVNEMAESIADLWSFTEEIGKYLFPIGTTIFWEGETAPPNFLVRDGVMVKIDEYPDLFEILGTRYGGDGVTTFGVGDYRGFFLRGYDSRKSIELGDKQGDAIRNITGSFSGTSAYTSVLVEKECAIGQGSGALYVADTVPGDAPSLANGSTNGKWANLSMDVSRMVPVADEVRPKNRHLLICIRAL